MRLLRCRETQAPWPRLARIWHEYAALSQSLCSPDGISSLENRHRCSAASEDPSAHRFGDRAYAATRAIFGPGAPLAPTAPAQPALAWLATAAAAAAMASGSPRNSRERGFKSSFRSYTTGVPLVYDLDDDLRPRSREFLGDPEAIAAAAAAVANQAKAG